MLTTTAVANTGNVLIDALAWGQKWTSTAPSLTIKVGILPTIEAAPTAAETAAVQSVLAEFERVLNIDFVFVGVDTAGVSDLTFKFYSDDAEARYGWSVPAGDARVAGFADVNILRNNYASTSAEFATGSSDYITLVHEFAHVLGLAHPHDAGGGSGIFPGVHSPTSLGYHGLNQGVFTTMSYNDGNQSAETWGWGISFIRVDSSGASSGGSMSYASSDDAMDFGLQSGLMALDIATLQMLYGANTQFASGNNTYALPTENAVGTAYTSIWDTAGIDTIFMPGHGDSVIDLRPATVLVAQGGGGFISGAEGIEGGFTIAAGVDIENATGNAGDDELIGNGLANILNGGGGDDILTGHGGKDTLLGGAGADTFIFNSDLDSGPTMLSADVIADFDMSQDLIDLRGIDASSLSIGNQAFMFSGFVGSFTTASQVRASYQSGNTVLYLNTDADMSTESVIVLNGIHLLSADDFLL